MYKIRKVVLGISGGVDSAVSALLLKRKGFEVQGVFMQNWDVRDEQGHCSADKDFLDAQYTCDKLDIPLAKVSFVKEYWNEVFMNLMSDYENGYTPNPDIMCNRNVKFKYFYKYAREELNADAIATGHYARTSFGCYLENYQPQRNVRLLKAKDEWKDQTFFLCQIEQEPLRHTMFPLGNLLKSQVKEIAKENGLEKIAHKKESMGICFIGKKDFKSFISDYLPDKPGKFIDIDTGLVMGDHNGIHQWTYGQRTRIPAVPDALYVARKDPATSTIYVVQGKKHPASHTTLFFTSPPHWISTEPQPVTDQEVFQCQFRFQRTHDLADCEIFKTNLGLIVLLDVQKRAITPGQYAVFYKGNECLGSARISHPGPSNFSCFWLQNKGMVKVGELLSRYYRRKLRKKDAQDVIENNTVPPLIQLKI